MAQTAKLFRIAKRNGLWGLFMYTLDGRGKLVPMKRPMRSYETLQGAWHAAEVRIARISNHSIR
jgi:hypothetical protein